MKRIVLCLGLLTIGTAAPGQFPINGKPVPAFGGVDSQMANFMIQPSRNISAGVLGISRGGRIVYLRAFGYQKPGVPLQENALFRLASVVKPITAAAIHRYSDAGGLGSAALQRKVFNLLGNGGLLSVSPPFLGDPRYSQVTIGHLLNHSGGWDRAEPNPPSPGDIPITEVRRAGIAMNQPDALPTRTQLIDWSLQFALNFAPGAASFTQTRNGVTVVPGVSTTYSNFGYLLLGEVLNRYAPGGYLGYLSTNVLTAKDWIPTSEWGVATTLQSSNSAREPVYEVTPGTDDSVLQDSVFDYSPPIAKLPTTYGGTYHLETMLAHGGLIATAQTMLRFGNLYRVAYVTQGAGATQTNDFGVAIGAAGLSDGAHTGSLPGASTIIVQRAGADAARDEVVFLAFNKRSGTSTDWANEAYITIIAPFLNGLSANGWPSDSCDGFWVTLGTENFSAGQGSYASNLQGFGSALGRVFDGSFLRLKPGHQAWTGTINQQVRLDAPEGEVTIGR